MNILYVKLLFLLFLFVVDVTSEKAPSPSNNLLNFVSVFEGFYTNREQYLRENFGESHNLLEVYILPVDVPAFYPRITFFLHELADGVTFRIELFEFIEEENDSIRLRRYSLTDQPASYGPGSFNMDSLKYLTPAELKTDKECDGLFTKVNTTVFFGTWRGCRLHGKGAPAPTYAEVCTCDSIVMHAPGDAKERSTGLPYILKKEKSYPIFSSMLEDNQEWVNPCEPINSGLVPSY